MRSLHSHEVVGNIFLFMVAGYETTSTSLASCTYILATRPDVQSKLFAEIDAQQWNGNDNEKDEFVANLTYMDMFIREVLRMFPVVTQAMARRCNATSTVCGYTVEKGLRLTCCQRDDESVCRRQRHSTGCVQYSLQCRSVGSRGSVCVRTRTPCSKAASSGLDAIWYRSEELRGHALRCDRIETMLDATSSPVYHSAGGDTGRRLSIE